MQVPIEFLAVGQGIASFALVGIPSAILGIACIVYSVIRHRKKSGSEDAAQIDVALLLGIILLLLALFSPTMDRIVLPIISRFNAR